MDEYNKGKDVVVIKETFRKRIELANSYSEEEADNKCEGLADEKKAIFNILRQGKQLEENEKNKTEEISIKRLDELKKENYGLINQLQQQQFSMQQAEHYLKLCLTQLIKQMILS